MRRFGPGWASLWVLLVWVALPAAAQAPAEYAVGFRIVDVPHPRGGAERMTMALWYPTDAQPAPHVYGGPTKGLVAVDAPLVDGAQRFPLLVFSHGYSGSGLGSVFFTEALARRGFIVAAPDHHDRANAVRIRGGEKTTLDRKELLAGLRALVSATPAGRGPYLYRLDELKAALTGVLADAVLGPRVDPQRIAVGGHSFGGFTALGLAGTLPQYADPRVKALVLFSTGTGGMLYTDVELGQVSVPLVLFLGEKERGDKRGKQTMAELSRRIIGSAKGPTLFLEVKGASHFSFNNRFSDRLGARLLSGDEPRYEVIRRFAIAFLERYLEDDAAAELVLDAPEALLTGRRRVPKAMQASPRRP